MSRVRLAMANAGARRPFVGFAFLFLGSTITAINYSAPSVIFAPVMRELHMNAASVTFVQTLFIACLGGCLILAGSLGDEVGKKRLCLIGLGVMMVADVVAAIAPTGATLLAARAVQGVGMAAFLSTMVALCSALFSDPRQKALAFSLFGASVGLAVTSSNVVGELCLTYLSWRWLFVVIEPPLLVAMVGIWLLVRDPAADRGPIRFDALGALLLALTVLPLIFGLSEGPMLGWSSGAIVALFVTAAAACALFNWHQMRRARRQQYIALDYSLFRSRGFGDGVLATFLYFAGGLGVMQIWPSALPRQVAALTPIALAYITAGMGVTFTMASLAASALARRVGVRNLVVAAIAVNLACLGVMLALFTVTRTISVGALAVLLAMFGAGYGIVFTKLTYLAVAPISADRSSSASGILLAARQTSTAIGAALLGALVQDPGGSPSSFVVLNGAACGLITLAFVASFFLKEPFAATEIRRAA